MSKIGKLCLGFALALACGTLSAATTHKVPSATFATIQAAVTFASSGDTISIGKNPASSDGAWYENVNVSGKTSLTITGKVVLDGNIAGAQGDCLSITGAAIGPFLISGITFRNGLAGVTTSGGAVDNITVTGCRGVNLQNAFVDVTGDGCTVSKCQIFACGELCDVTGDDLLYTGNKAFVSLGAVLATGSSPKVVKNLFQDVEPSGPLISLTGASAQIVSNTGRTCDGTFVLNGTGPVFSGNKFFNQNSGLTVTGANGGTFEKNKFDTCDDGIFDIVGNDVTISGNALSNCAGRAIDLDGTGAIVSGNKISSVFDFAIVVNGDDAQVLSNSVLRCSAGLDITSSGATIDKNKISVLYGGNGGIDVTGDGVTITNNSISDGAHGCPGIYLTAASSGGGLIEKNQISNMAEEGIFTIADNITVNACTVANSGAKWQAGISVGGTSCEVTNCKVSGSSGDGINISGDDNEVVNCTSTNNAQDGFDCDGTLDGNTFTNCKASGNGGEGFDNSSCTNTTVDGGSFTKNRIDFAGNGNVTFIATPKIGDGSGIATVPEVD